MSQAKAKLSEIDVYCGNEPTFAGLAGWVFEQTVQHCLARELQAQGLVTGIEEQTSLGGRARADLTIGRLAIELKTRGLFGAKDVERYAKYRAAAEHRGYRYLFVTMQETHVPYRDGIIKAVGKDNVFVLGDGDQWSRLVDVVAAHLRKREDAQQSDP